MVLLTFFTSFNLLTIVIYLKIRRNHLLDHFYKLHKKDFLDIGTYNQWVQDYTSPLIKTASVFYTPRVFGCENIIVEYNRYVNRSNKILKGLFLSFFVLIIIIVLIDQYYLN